MLASISKRISLVGERKRDSIALGEKGRRGWEEESNIRGGYIM